MPPRPIIWKLDIPCWILDIQKISSPVAMRAGIFAWRGAGDATEDVVELADGTEAGIHRDVKDFCVRGGEQALRVGDALLVDVAHEADAAGFVETFVGVGFVQPRVAGNAADGEFGVAEVFGNVGEHPADAGDGDRWRAVVPSRRGAWRHASI